MIYILSVEHYLDICKAKKVIKKLFFLITFSIIKNGRFRPLSLIHCL